MCEKLVDVEERFQLWRFRHMTTVKRIIGFAQGTGGSSGVGFLKKALDLTFFPELWEVRTHLAAAAEALSINSSPNGSFREHASPRPPRGHSRSCNPCGRSTEDATRARAAMRSRRFA